MIAWPLPGSVYLALSTEGWFRRPAIRVFGVYFLQRVLMLQSRYSKQPVLRADTFHSWFPSTTILVLDIQGPMMLLGFANPFYYNPYLGFFLQMIPYAFTIIVLVIGSQEANRKRIGAPAALGLPYIRGERGQ